MPNGQSNKARYMSRSSKGDIVVGDSAVLRGSACMAGSDDQVLPKIGSSA